MTQKTHLQREEIERIQDKFASHNFNALNFWAIFWFLLGLIMGLWM